MRRPYCYIVENKKGHDLGSAEVYGDVMIVYQHPPADVFMLSKHAFTLKTLLDEAQPSDYLIVSGNMILAMLAFSVLLKKFGSVNVLLFDVRNNQYVPRVVAQHQL